MREPKEYFLNYHDTNGWEVISLNENEEFKQVYLVEAKAYRELQFENQRLKMIIKDFVKSVGEV